MLNGVVINAVTLNIFDNSLDVFNEPFNDRMIKIIRFYLKEVPKYIKYSIHSKVFFLIKISSVKLLKLNIFKLIT